MFLLWLFLAGCSSNNPKDVDATTEQEITAEVTADVAKDQEPDDSNNPDTTVAVAEEDACTIYLDVMQCLIDTYPEEYANDPDSDMASLKAAIYGPEVPEDQRQWICQFSLSMTQQAAKKSDEYSTELDSCGLLTLELDDTENDFFGGLEWLMKQANQ